MKLDASYLEVSPVPTWIYDPASLRFLAVNDAVIEKYGYSREEFLAMDLRAIRPPGDVERFMRDLPRMRALSALSGAWTHRAKDGTEFRVSILGFETSFNGAPARIACVFDWATSSSEQILGEVPWGERYSALMALFEEASDVVFLKDLSGKYVLANRAATGLFLRPPSEILGKTDVELLGTESAERLRQQDLSALQESGPSTFVNTFGVGEERRVFVSTLSAYQGLDGQVIGIFGIARELDQSRRISDPQEKLTRERLVAAIGHDLRNPLSCIRASAQLIRRLDGRTEGRSELLGSLVDKILECADRSDRMIRDLLDASRVEAGQRLSLTMGTCDLGEVARQAVSDLCATHGPRFNLRIRGPLLGHWSADSLRRVIENLCTNAIRYGAPGASIEIVVEADAADPGVVRLSVHNFGSPIPDAERSVIFEPFRRARASQPGWGLGLTVVRGLAEAHGGKVEVESSPELGTRFSVLLPVDARQAL